MLFLEQKTKDSNLLNPPHCNSLMKIYHNSSFTNQVTNLVNVLTSRSLKVDTKCHFLGNPLEICITKGQFLFNDGFKTPGVFDDV